MKHTSLLKRVLLASTFVSMLVSLYLVFVWVPVERQMGPVQKIFYFHVPSAWVAFFAFFVVFAASLMFLKTRLELYDIIAGCSAQVGVVFTAIVLITGPIWGRASWGTWWTWDPRLTTTLILWFIYLAYLIIRNSAKGHVRNLRLAAVFGIIGFIDVPIVFMAVRWWRTIHPVVFEANNIGLPPSMLTTLMVCLLTFTLLYFVLLLKSMKIEQVERKLQNLISEALKAY
ncbi:cytochrome C assembly protein [Desulfosporosinus sp. HMP52]|uniref:cytochrome c biogenesis protein CcsA n=1 Tax=Desulfosporosinus sp. HMP52 TaxID=1487923 RepID=UPI00051F9C4A|nr:cytochrome c biogenesis protein CcsA [Desulfosporosinus sp. HMP52]KGK89071.1 cytochrome C assembly protein [Desulfosporosinus sp. HMP52]